MTLILTTLIGFGISTFIYGFSWTNNPIRFPLLGGTRRFGDGSVDKALAVQTKIREFRSPAPIRMPGGHSGLRVRLVFRRQIQGIPGTSG